MSPFSRARLRGRAGAVGAGYRGSARLSCELLKPTIILDGVKADRWRILVGADAHKIDEMARQSPERAYDIGFFDEFARAAGGPSASLSRIPNSARRETRTIEAKAAMAAYKGPMVRICLPPAESPRLAGFLPSPGEKPAFRAGVGARQVQRGQQRRVSRGALRRQAGISLSGQIPVSRPSMRRWLDEFRSGSGKAEHGPLLVPGKR